MQSWATEELKYAALPDKRLNKRLIKIVENLARQPHASIPLDIIPLDGTGLHQDGGFLARRHDGFPGVKTIWQGLSCYAFKL